MALSLAEDDGDDGEEDVEQSRKITTEKAEEMESRRGYRPARMSLRLQASGIIFCVCSPG